MMQHSDHGFLVPTTLPPASARGVHAASAPLGLVADTDHCVIPETSIIGIYNSSLDEPGIDMEPVGAMCIDTGEGFHGIEGFSRVESKANGTFGP